MISTPVTLPGYYGGSGSTRRFYVVRRLRAVCLLTQAVALFPLRTYYSVMIIVFRLLSKNYGNTCSYTSGSFHTDLLRARIAQPTWRSRAGVSISASSSSVSLSESDPDPSPSDPMSRCLAACNSCSRFSWSNLSHGRRRYGYCLTYEVNPHGT